MSRQRISDMEKVSQEEPPPYRQNHEDPATPTAVTSRGWFTSLRRRLGFDVEDFRLKPLLTTPVAVQDGSLSKSSAPELWPELFALTESGDVDLASPPELVDDPPPVVKRSIHTFFCNPQYHSTKGQVKSTVTVHQALYWYQTAGYVEIPPTWRGHLADFAILDEISVTLDPLCPTRRVYTRTISIDYQRGHSESRQGPPEFLVLRPRDFKSRAEARVEVSVSCRSREWLSNEPPDNFSNLIFKDAAVVSLGLEWPDTDPLTMAELFEVFPWGDWMPDIEPWLVSRYASTVVRGLGAPSALLGLPAESSNLSDLFDENLRRNVLCQEGCNSKHVTCSHMSTTFLELEASRTELARGSPLYF